MKQDEYILNELGATDASPEQKATLLEQVRTRIGEAITEGLTEQQLNEYQAIIDNRTLVIELWLKQHVPEYKNLVVYQEIAAAAANDPEKNSPEKIFANLAWIQLNVPNIEEITLRVLRDYKTQADTNK